MTHFDYTYTLLIPLIPLFVFLVLGLGGHKMKPVIAGIIGTTGLLVAAVLSYFTAYMYFFKNHTEGAYEKILAYNITWQTISDKLHVDLGVLLDPIAVMMLVVITTVSLMVHTYSIGYMKGEKGFQRFFAFLSLFTFSMLGLVLATNIFQMYIFWELVGVSSFLLIGFYYEKPSAVAASKKAFIVTRFADFGFLIGILLLSYTTDTFDFISLTDPAKISMLHPVGGVFMGVSIMTWALLFIFMGGMGKSAMFPLHIWLPDAMEGPTPVSALIHAATMVVAGVYLVARLFPLFSMVSPHGIEVVGYIGAFTSLFAAVIACTQTDIKRVLAFSTMSQIGYMMLALGVAQYVEGPDKHEAGLGYMASMFHLFTHAFFKALLFLGAGSIIHAVHSNDMRDMGNLRKYLPVTFWTFLIGWLAICGFPGLSGFWSKDEILVAAFHHNKIIFYTAVLVAGMTAFYMSRLFFSVFFGKKQHYHHEPHESPAIMTIPLLILAAFSIFAGYVPFDKLITANGIEIETHLNYAIAVPVTTLAFLGMGLAFIMYRKESAIPDKMANGLKLLYTGSLNKFYFDEIYMFVTKKILFNCVSKPIAWFDRHVVDGFMNFLAWITNLVSEKIKGFQSGQVQQYAYVFITGTLLLAMIFAYLMTNLN